MLETPIMVKVVPIAIAGMIAMTPISNPTQAILQLKQKIVTTTINKEVTNTENGYNEKITIERKEDIPEERKRHIKDKPGLISKTWDFGKGVATKIYWWVVK